MAQPPILITTPGRCGSNFLHQILGKGLLFRIANTTETLYALNDQNLEGDTVYACHVPLKSIPYKLTNVVSICRDPRDVAISAAHYNSSSTEEFNNLINHYIQSTHNPEWYASYMAYYRIVSHWRLRFEDIIESPIPILNFLNHYQYVYNAELIRKEWYNHCFDNLQNKEKRISGYIKHYRKGETGEYKTVFDEEQQKDYLSVHSKLMALYGYC